MRRKTGFVKCQVRIYLMSEIIFYKNETAGEKANQRVNTKTGKNVTARNPVMQLADWQRSVAIFFHLKLRVTFMTTAANPKKSHGSFSNSSNKTLASF